MGYLETLFAGTRRQNDEVVLGLLEENPHVRLLDCGCGDGVFTLLAATQIGTAHITGVEYVPVLAAESRAKGVTVIAADLNEGLPFRDQVFDVVLANQLIEHLHNTDVFIRELRRILRPRGYAVIATNNLASWHNILSLTLGKQPMPAHISNEVILGNRFNPLNGQRHRDSGQVHHRVFAWDAIRELVEYHGFHCERVRGAGYYPVLPPLSSVLSVLDPRHAAYVVVKARNPV